MLQMQQATYCCWDAPEGLLQASLSPPPLLTDQGGGVDRHHGGAGCQCRRHVQALRQGQSQDLPPTARH